LSISITLMIQRITATLLLALMVFVTVAGKQSVNYCLTQKEFFLFDCPAIDSTTTASNSCEHCSSCGTTDSKKNNKFDILHPTDCCVELSLGVDSDWLEATNIRLSEAKYKAVSVVWYDDSLLKSITNHSDITARGPPPQRPLSPPVPIHIRHSVFLI